MVTNDPYYNRKPVPDAFIEHVGDSGLTQQEEYLNRERKLSSQGGDLRKFSNPKSNGQLDPHYARKPVPESMITGVGDTGLTREEEFQNREQKMFQNGVDLRRFSTSANGGMEPQNDPYYGRKQVDSAMIDGVGESGMSKAEEFETRENKAAMFDLSSDPFQQIAGTGHRGSISAVASDGAADARRRSSAVAPDTARATANVGHGTHSGYTGDTSLPPIAAGQDKFVDPAYGSTTTTTTTRTTTTTNPTTTTTGGQHGLYHDIATHDPESVGPHEQR